MFVRRSAQMLSVGLASMVITHAVHIDSIIKCITCKIEMEQEQLCCCHAYQWQSQQEP